MCVRVCLCRFELNRDYIANIKGQRNHNDINYQQKQKISSECCVVIYIDMKTFTNWVNKEYLITNNSLINIIT